MVECIHNVSTLGLCAGLYLICFLLLEKQKVPLSSGGEDEGLFQLEYMNRA